MDAGECNKCTGTLYGEDDGGILCMTCGEPHSKLPKGGTLIWDSQLDQNAEKTKIRDKGQLSPTGRKSVNHIPMEEQIARKRENRTTTVPLNSIANLEGVNGDPAKVGPKRGTTPQVGNGFKNAKGPPRNTPPLTEEQKESQLLQSMNARQRRARERSRAKQAENARKAEIRKARKNGKPSPPPQKDGEGPSALGF